MIPPALLNTNVTIRRRTSTGRDALNNPIYGAPTSGTGWNTVYTNMMVRLAFSSKGIRFTAEGERIQPVGTMYYNIGNVLQMEDRVITQPDGIEYVVIGISTGATVGNIVDHFEVSLQLP